MSKIEILAPCGGFESVVAAARSGADAVYLGAKDFSARAGAENFSADSLREAVEYCHIRGVRVHLTLNTVVFDDEINNVIKVIKDVAEAGVDALIVQNMGVAALCKKIVPDLPLHASTQMSVHSPSGAKLLYENGFSRVVLARELSREEIIEIKNACPEIELEVFVHGALCMSVSGQCLFSAVIGSRSGNRGRCAQTCRLPFSVNGRKGYALSLKDNSIIDYLRDLQEIGVNSAKIEGRLKRPEYVSAAVRACVQSRDRGFVDEETKNRLESVFSRTGFTDGYYAARRGYEMFGYRQKEDVISATSGLLAEIRNSYKDEPKRVGTAMFFRAKIGEKPSLTVNCEGATATVSADCFCEKAINRALDEAAVKKQLSKSGGTPYNITDIDIDMDGGLSLPLSALNELRRNAIDAISDIRAHRVKYKINDYQPEAFAPHKAGTKKRRARFSSAAIGKGFKEFDLCFVPFNSDREAVKNLINSGFKLGAEIPRALFGREQTIIGKLKELKVLGVEDVLCNNLAAVYIAKSLGFKIHGGFGLNFTNTLDLLWAESYGFADTELSFEITFDRAEKLGGALPRGLIGYGYIPVMLCRNCPNKSVGVSCRDCQGSSKMKDRLNKTFIFYCDGCATEILNSVPLDVINEVENTNSIDFEIFRFSVENYVEKVERFPDFIGYAAKNKEKTRGLYLRGVE